METEKVKYETLFLTAKSYMASVFVLLPTIMPRKSLILIWVSK